MSQTESRHAGTWRQSSDGGRGLEPSRLHDTISRPEAQAVFNAQGKPIGYVDGDGWLVKTHLDPDKHMLRKPEGWASDVAHVALPIKGIRLVTVGGVVWEAGIELWRRYAIAIDRGFGRQVVLPARYWQVHRPGDGRQLALVLGV
jgi:hypothetical protein